ncbi:MAG: hypothetical protein ABR599_07950 [Gemmatimonadota bacterium]
MQRSIRISSAAAVIGAALLGLVSASAAARAQQAGTVEVPAATANTVGEQLVRGFSQDSPFDPDAPDHLWLDNGDGTFLFLHFDKPLPEAKRIIYTGWAVKGRWCAEDQPKGFTHFHRTAKVAAWDAGHGGSKPGEQGYWLKHVAVERFDMPEMMGMPARTIEPGLDREFMPTKAPSCGNAQGRT